MDTAFRTSDSQRTLTPAARERITNTLEYYRAAARVMGRNRNARDPKKQGTQAGYSIAWFYEDVCTPERFDQLTPQVQNFLLSRAGEQGSQPATPGARIPVPAHALLENKPGISLNASQMKSLELALNEPVSIVQGPPGTGKTETILNMVSSMLALPGNPTVAVVANNSEAINNIAEKINETLEKNPTDAPNRLKLAHSYAQLGNRDVRRDWVKAHPAAGEKFPFKYAGQEPAIKAEDFLAQFPFITSTIHSLTKCFENGRRYRYDYVIMDEASQCGVMLGLIPMNFAKHLVLVGDTKQLPPVYVEDLEPEIARAAKGSEEPQGHLALTRVDASGREGNSILDAAADAFPGNNSILLDEHYRCHPGIIEFCNREFYDGELKIKTPGYRPEDKQFPPIRVRWFSGNYSEPCPPELTEGDFKAKPDEEPEKRDGDHADEQDEQEPAKRRDPVNRIRTSKRNIRQVETFMTEELPLLAKRLLEPEPPTFCILSPFKGQIEYIKQLLERIDLTNELSIQAIAAGNDPMSASALAGYALESDGTAKKSGDDKKDDDARGLTIHKSQGHEYDIVYFLPVDDVNWEWPWSQGGRLVNVAVSRAKKELVIIASSSLMSEEGQRELVAAGLMSEECVVPPYRKPKNEPLTEDGDGGNLRYVEQLLEYVRACGSERFPRANGDYGYVHSPMTSIFDKVAGCRALNNTTPASDEEREWMTERALSDALDQIDLAGRGLMLLRDVRMREFDSRNDWYDALFNDHEVNQDELFSFVYDDVNHTEGSHFDFAIIQEKTRRLVLAIEVDGAPHRSVRNQDVHGKKLAPEEAARVKIAYLAHRLKNDSLKDRVVVDLGGRVLQGNNRSAWTDERDELLRATVAPERPCFTMLRLPTDGSTAWEVDRLKAAASKVTDRTSHFVTIEELLDEQLSLGVETAPKLAWVQFKRRVAKAKEAAERREQSAAATHCAPASENNGATHAKGEKMTQTHTDAAAHDVGQADEPIAPGIAKLVAQWRNEDKDFPISSGAKANATLAQAGLIRKEDKDWHATEAGLALGIACNLREFKDGAHYQCTYPEVCQQAIKDILMGKEPSPVSVNERHAPASIEDERPPFWDDEDDPLPDDDRPPFWDEDDETPSPDDNEVPFPEDDDAPFTDDSDKPCLASAATAPSQGLDSMSSRGIYADGLRFGSALDRYTTSSTLIDDFHFENEYSPLGQLVHNLKYAENDQAAREKIVRDMLECAEPALERMQFFQKRGLVATPMPPTIKREFDPVSHLTELLAQKRHIPYNPNILRKNSELRAKSLPLGEEFDDDAFSCDLTQIKPDTPLLIVDDVYGQGRSLRGCLRALKRAGHTGPVYLICMVYTRGNGLIGSK